MHRGRIGLMCWECMHNSECAQKLGAVCSVAHNVSERTQPRVEVACGKNDSTCYCFLFGTVCHKIEREVRELYYTQRQLCSKSQIPDILHNSEVLNSDNENCRQQCSILLRATLYMFFVKIYSV